MHLKRFHNRSLYMQFHSIPQEVSQMTKNEVNMAHFRDATIDSTTIDRHIERFGHSPLNLIDVLQHLPPLADPNLKLLVAAVPHYDQLSEMYEIGRRTGVLGPPVLQFISEMITDPYFLTRMDLNDVLKNRLA